MINYMAINKGEKALDSLKEALDALSSASNWGILDILGGGNFISFFKHTKIDKARTLLYRSKIELSEFMDELAYTPGVEINISTFLTFLDVFSNSLIADILVQAKISEAKKQVIKAIRETENALKKLRIV